MSTVVSKDGTKIAYEKTGQGPAVILVNGAMGIRAFGFSAKVAELLASHSTVYDYDRRGRGESTDNPSSVDKEIEDINERITILNYEKEQINGEV